MRHFFSSALTLWKRELVRFYRDRSRVIGGLVPPIIFWVFIGTGFSGSFRPGTGEGISYMHYFFPGILTLIFLFTAVFSSISIIEDRHEGFLQSVLVAPVSRTAVVFGKVFGSATLALIQGIPFLIIGLIFGISPEVGSIVKMMLILFGASFSLAAIGFMLAWNLDSTQGFHAVMNMFLIPMWLLSGALFPKSGVPSWLDWLVTVNPLTYTVSALQQVLFLPGTFEGLPSPGLCAVVNVAFCLVTFGMAVIVSQKGEK
ncbi:MAG: ABC transporter permease [Nitrospinota bacterium]|nr:ABC transporter permease [Nitrospinota bacterium]